MKRRSPQSSPCHISTVPPCRLVFAGDPVRRPGLPSSAHGQLWRGLDLHPAPSLSPPSHRQLWELHWHFPVSARRAHASLTPTPFLSGLLSLGSLSGAPFSHRACWGPQDMRVTLWQAWHTSDSHLHVQHQAPPACHALILLSSHQLLGHRAALQSLIPPAPGPLQQGPLPIATLD